MNAYKYLSQESAGREEELLRAAMSLPPKARARLADQLLASLHGDNQQAIDNAWAEEAERRMQEIRDGKVEAIDGEMVMEELRSRPK